MSHDPELVAETRGWLVRARTDLASGRADLTVQPPLTGDAVFHAQQAAEKAMKGFLTWHGRVFRKTHNLTELGELCARLDPTLEPLLRRASGLTDYAWKFRYPGEPDEPPRGEAEEALALAREVYEQILVRLPREVAPSSIG
ncbi:MAG: HEPN domain-containing protein [Armatimonadota bacterium]|nr:HEPN domain-containing protein [Armatimonadota bacterium]